MYHLNQKWESGGEMPLLPKRTKGPSKPNKLLTTSFKTHEKPLQKAEKIHPDHGQISLRLKKNGLRHWKTSLSDRKTNPGKWQTGLADYQTTTINSNRCLRDCQTSLMDYQTSLNDCQTSPNDKQTILIDYQTGLTDCQTTLSKWQKRLKQEKQMTESRQVSKTVVHFKKGLGTGLILCPKKTNFYQFKTNYYEKY